MGKALRDVPDELVAATEPDGEVYEPPRLFLARDSKLFAPG